MGGNKVPKSSCLKFRNKWKLGLNYKLTWPFHLIITDFQLVWQIISTALLAWVAWRFWLGALSNKVGRGQRNREEIGAEQLETCFYFIFLAATPLLRPAQQNRHATQATALQQQDWSFS